MALFAGRNQNREIVKGNGTPEEEGYEGEVHPLRFLLEEKVPSSRGASLESAAAAAAANGTSLLPPPSLPPSLTLCRPSSLLFSRCLFFFCARPRVPRDAFGAPCLVIRVMYGTLIELRRNGNRATTKSITPPLLFPLHPPPPDRIAQNSRKHR